MPRPRFTVRLAVPGTPEQVWQRLWDLDRHTAAIPFTIVRASDPLGDGVAFVARTGRRLGFDDRMVVRHWQVPTRAVVEKQGPWLRGTITVTLTPLTGPDADPRTEVVWRQTYGARGVPDLLAACVRPLVRRGYSRALRAIVG